MRCSERKYIFAFNATVVATTYTCYNANGEELSSTLANSTDLEYYLDWATGEECKVSAVATTVKPSLTPITSGVHPGQGKSLCSIRKRLNQSNF